MSMLLDCLYLILGLFYLPGIIFTGKHRAGLRERLGIYPETVKALLKNKNTLIWLHAVSVGEIKAAISLIEALRKNFPQKKLLFSTITPAGNSVARGLALPGDIVVYFPFDLSFIVKKVLDLVKPQAILIMETELWPNIIMESYKRNIPIAIVNGRISDKAFPRYQRVSALFKQAIENISLFCMQANIDAQRIISLGASPEKVFIAGNLKFDQPVKNTESKNLALALKNDELLIVGGSTHNPEEEILVRVYNKLREKGHNVRLLIAPRHIQRVKEIEKMLDKYGLKTCLLSRYCGSEVVSDSKTVFVLDIMGALNRFYELCDIVFVGGSLVAHGGQNPIEPAACKKAVIFGKYMFNFTDVARIFLEDKAAMSVDNADQLFDACTLLLQDKKIRDDWGERAWQVVLKNRGSAEKIFSLLKTRVLK